MRVTFFDWLRKAKSPMAGFLCMVLMINIGAPVAIASSDFPPPDDNTLSVNASSSVIKYGVGTLLCSSGGYRWVSFADLGVDESAPRQGSHCVFCLNLGDDLDQDSAVYSLSVLLVVKQPHNSKTKPKLAFATKLPAPQARAPPTILL